MNIRPFITLVLFLLVCPVPARGDEVCFVPSLAVKGESNSNIILATDSENVRRDYITTLSPGFELTDKTERLDSLLLIRLDRLLYSRNKDLDATNQLYSGSVRYNATELLRVSTDATYQKNFNPSLDIGWASGPPPGTIIPVIIVPPPRRPEIPAAETVAEAETDRVHPHPHPDPQTHPKSRRSLSCQCRFGAFHHRCPQTID